MTRYTIADLDKLALRLNIAFDTPPTLADKNGNYNPGHYFIEKHRNGVSVAQIMNSTGRVNSPSHWAASHLFGIPPRTTKKQLRDALTIVLSTIETVKGKK